MKLAALGLVGLGACASPGNIDAGSDSGEAEGFLDDVQRRTFRYFWETTNPRSGLTPDRSPNPPFASIAAVGFALTAYPIGVERDYVTRAQAAERTLSTLRFFWRAPQGAAVTLNATLSTDPDSNIAFFVWRRDSETGPLVTDPLFTPTITTQQPLGEKTYHLRVVDKRFAADGTFAKVQVIDSAPPSRT